MSKLIESLRAGASQFAKRPTNGHAVTAEKTAHELTQQQLADIYFSSGSEKAKKSEYPLVIKVVEKPRPAALLPWVITSLAFLITAFSLFSTKRIFVDVKVIDEKSPYWAAMSGGTLPVSAAPASVESLPQETLGPVAETGPGERIATDRFIFEGAAKIKSNKDRSMLVLANSSVAPFARANLFFNPARDFAAQKIVFLAKGQHGGENLAIAIKDRSNIQAFDRGRLLLFPNGLGSEWQTAEIALSDLPKEFDERHVAQMRFEFGSKEVNNKPGDTVFVKDIRVVSL